MPVKQCRVLSIKTELATLNDEFIRINGFGTQGNYVLISVSDTGTGMDKQTKEHIFEPFFTTKGIGKGTGLGLSSTYGTVKQHNGFITVSSELGCGSTFCVYFPLFDTAKKEPILSKDVPHLSLINEEKAGVTTPEKNVKKGGGTIIIAEDDPWVRELIADILEVDGYKTVGASDGEEAIRIFSEYKEQVALIIIDVGMPKKNGIEVFEEIRKIRPDITALFTSGIADDLILSREIQHGTFEFIAKPLSHDELLIKVNKILGN
jgi:two-component system cell cycle sensor histidine kinase/response regulator CckA